MKKRLLLSFIVSYALCHNSFSQTWEWETYYTPTGDEILGGVLDMDYELTEIQKDSLEEMFLNYYNNRIIVLGEATRKYNCHGYAWHMTEGTDTVFIYTPYDDVYWEGDEFDASYKEVGPYTNAKISYVDCDHSAIRTNASDIYISKWGLGPKFQHNRNDCPFISDTYNYYKLDPKMTGSTSPLCYNVQRPFITNITHMPEATLTWTKSGFLTYVSGAGTSEFIVKGSGNGDSSVEFAINTPSGFYWSSEKEIWTGKPVITNKKVDGGSYYSGMQICPGDHYLTVTISEDSEADNASWTVPGGIYYFVGTNMLEFTFPSYLNSISISANTSNTCGTSTNASFYLTKRTYGCSKSLSIVLYPNPATETFLVSIKDSSEETDTNDISSKKYAVKIFNNQSLLVYSTETKSKSIEISTNKLEKGSYFVEVQDGITSCSQKLIIEKRQ